MENLKTKGCTGGNRAANKTAHAFDSTSLTRIWFIAKHVATTLPVECAALIFLLLLAAFTAAGVTQ